MAKEGLVHPGQCGWEKVILSQKTKGRPPTYGPEHIIYLNCGPKKNRIVPGAQVTTIIIDKTKK